MKQYFYDAHKNQIYELVDSGHIQFACTYSHPYKIGRWGRLRREYLQINYPQILENLISTGQLWSYLDGFNSCAQAYFDECVHQICMSNNATCLNSEGTELHNQSMQQIYQYAETTVLREYVYKLKSNA